MQKYRYMLINKQGNVVWKCNKNKKTKNNRYHNVQEKSNFFILYAN